MEPEDEWACPDYEVTCARCGKKLMASAARVEEGDEWECPPCNDLYDAIDFLESRHVHINTRDENGVSRRLAPDTIIALAAVVRAYEKTKLPTGNQ